MIKAHLALIFEKLGVRNRSQGGVLLPSLDLNDPARALPPAFDLESVPAGESRA